MARGIKWQVKFTSRQNIPCHIDIYKEDYSGPVTQLTGAADPFEYQEESSKNLLDFVRYKTGYIRIIATNYYTYAELSPKTILSHFVKVWYGSELVFTGYIKCQEYSGNWTAIPYEINLPVISPLGLIASFNFRAPSQIGMVTLMSLMQEINSKLKGEYDSIVYPGTNSAPWVCKMFSTICAPFNENFKHYQTTDDLYSPQTFEYFIEGVCAWLGMIVHDTPGKIVFQKIDYSGAYSSISLNDSNRSSKSVETTSFVDKFTFVGNNHKRQVLPPLKEIHIKSDGDEISQSIDTKKSVSVLYNEDFTSGELRFIDPQISATHLGTFLECLTVGGTYPYVFNLANNGSEKIYIIIGTETTTSTELLGVKFMEVPKCSDQLTLKVKIARGDSMVNMEQADYDPFFLNVQITQGSRVLYSESRREVVGEFNVFIHPYSDQHSDMSFEPIQVRLYPSADSGLSSGDTLRIDEMTLFAPDCTNDGYTFASGQMFRSDYTVKGEIAGYEDKSVDVHFQNYGKMICSHSLGTDGAISTAFPQYSYMFRPQTFLDLTVRRKTTDANPQDRMYIDSWDTVINDYQQKFAIIADRFKPRDDQHTFTLYEL